MINDNSDLNNQRPHRDNKKIPTLLIVVILSFIFSLFVIKIKVDRAHAINRHDPNAVLQAYFDAWEHNDWTTQASLLDKKYSHMVPEPVKSLTLLETQIISNQLLEKVYVVTFEIQVKGQGVVLHSGQYKWTFYISWDVSRDEWVITNYGEG